MKNVAKIARQALTSTTTLGRKDLSTNHSDSINGEMVNVAFKQLTQIFPAWRQAVGSKNEEDVQEWSAGYKRQLVRAFRDQRIDSPEKLRHGLKMARSEAVDFMPGPGKFASWCKLHQAPYHVPFNKENALPHLPSTPEHAAEQIAKIKSKLSQSHRGTNK